MANLFQYFGYMVFGYMVNFSRTKPWTLYPKPGVCGFQFPSKRYISRQQEMNMYGWQIKMFVCDKE